MNATQDYLIICPKFLVIYDCLIAYVNFIIKNNNNSHASKLVKFEYTVRQFIDFVMKILIYLSRQARMIVIKLRLC